LDYISENGSIVLDPEVDESHINRMTMMVYHCKLQHKAKGCRVKTLPKFIQGELQKCALDAEQVTKSTLRNFRQHQSVAAKYGKIG
jgi:hypothetical protein